MSEDKPKVDLNVVQVASSALAAVSSAVLLSTVGVAGTLIGAAAGSVIATVGGSIYSYSLRVSRERVAAAAQVAASVRSRRVGEDGTTQQLPSQDEAHVGEAAGDDVESGPSWRESLAHLSWRRVAALTGAVFLAAMVVIVGFELIAGRPVSEYTGGTSRSDSSRTTIPGLGSHKAKATPQPKPSPSASSSATPTGDASSSVTASPTSSPSESATPTNAASPTPSATAGTTPTPAPTAGTTPAQ